MSKQFKDWLIWSFEHDAWWAPSGWGYTKDVLKAGHYTKEEANAICDHANKYSDSLKEKMVHESEAAQFNP